jgi:uncharacterized protein
MATAGLQDARQLLGRVLDDIGPAIVACSGGVDSLLLATIVHRAAPEQTIIAHALSPAVPAAATRRVKAHTATEGWRLEIIQSGEYEDPVYRANPVNRCYYCKSHLYRALSAIAANEAARGDRTYAILSGANSDDLGEYRPGLQAAREFGVRHPFVESSISKALIRSLARDLNLPFSELPASPCLASRLYTGTPVTDVRLAAIERGETFVKRVTGVEIVRCRIRENIMYVEVPAGQRDSITAEVLDALRTELASFEAVIVDVVLDPLPYASGRAFVVTQ